MLPARAWACASSAAICVGSASASSNQRPAAVGTPCCRTLAVPSGCRAPASVGCWLLITGYYPQRPLSCRRGSVPASIHCPLSAGCWLPAPALAPPPPPPPSLVVVRLLSSRGGRPPRPPFPLSVVRCPLSAGCWLLAADYCLPSPSLPSLFVPSVPSKKSHLPPLTACHPIGYNTHQKLGRGVVCADVEQVTRC